MVEFGWEAVVTQQETRKQQIARRLRLSERVLEQYFQLKRAEVEDESATVQSPTSTSTTVFETRPVNDKDRKAEQRV